MSAGKNVIELGAIVVDPCLQHAVKKLLVAGGRGGGKDISRDIQETIDALRRWQEMREEEKPKEPALAPPLKEKTTLDHRPHRAGDWT